MSSSSRWRASACCGTASLDQNSAEIVVVGAGVMGSATAHALARQGRDVLLVEQFEVGHERGSSHGRSRRGLRLSRARVRRAGKGSVRRLARARTRSGRRAARAGRCSKWSRARARALSSRPRYGRRVLRAPRSRKPPTPLAGGESRTVGRCCSSPKQGSSAPTQRIVGVRRPRRGERHATRGEHANPIPEQSMPTPSWSPPGRGVPRALPGSAVRGHARDRRVLPPRRTATPSVVQLDPVTRGHAMYRCTTRYTA